MAVCADCKKELDPERDGTDRCQDCLQPVRQQQSENPGSPHADGEDHDGRELMRRLQQLTPRVFVTPAIIATNTAIFIAMIATGVSASNPSSASLLKWGAAFGPYTMDGQWWRLLTATFLHGGIIHLALNMWVLWDLGRMAERLFGNWRFLAVYLVCGLGGSVASLWWHPMVVGVGASGAVFGLGGALLGSLYLRKHPLPATSIKKQVRSLLFFIGYNVFYGWGHNGIDNAAHIGGLVTGIVLGALLTVELPDGAVEANVLNSSEITPESGGFAGRYGALLAMAIVIVATAALVASRSGLVDTRQADRLIAAGNNDAAAAKLHSAIRKDPKLPFPHYMLGGIYLEKRQFQEAKEEFTTVIKLAPESPGGYDGLGRVYLQEDKPELAIQQFLLAVEKDRGDADTHFRLGMAYLADGQTGKAIEALNKSIAVTPSAEAYYFLGRAYASQSETAQAIVALKKAAEINPAYAPARDFLKQMESEQTSR